MSRPWNISSSHYQWVSVRTYILSRLAFNLALCFAIRVGWAWMFNVQSGGFMVPLLDEQVWEAAVVAVVAEKTESIANG